MYALHLALLAGLKQQSVLLFPLMVLAISNLLETMRALRTMHREQNELIHVLAHDDVLTGLPNRFSLQTSMSQAIDQARKTNASLAVMVVDLDRFKAINDPLGHAVGDQILVETGRRLKAALDPADIVARLGSDEFGILIQGANRQHAAERVEQALAALSAPHRGAASQELHVTSSAGISLYPEDGADAATLLRNADTAMHRAKTRGGNTYCFYTADLNQLALERLQIESDLRHALERKQLELFYQPQVDMHTGELIGAEALIRWNHPTLGLLTPDRFVPLAEDSTLILSMGKWVLQTACEQLRSWREQGLTQIRQIAVNLSARQFAQEDLPLLVEHILREFELDPAQLEIEITESVAMQDPERSLNILRTLKQMGVTLAVDDFGTGHSSLTYLKQFPIDILKIDGSFVRDLETNVSDAEICASTIALAHKLGLKVVAEGIETPGQFDFLKRSACDTAQGFGIGLPVRASQIVNFSPSVPVA
jgi:diguanylate cyclase (GGDEF)-like protein